MPLLIPKNKRFWTNLFALLAMALAIGLLVSANMDRNQTRQVSSLMNKTPDKNDVKIADTTTPK